MNAELTDLDQATLMIVDDEPENLNVLGEILRAAGWSVRAFPRGALALAAAMDEPPAMVLLDVRMPHMDGHEVCQRFKAEPRLCQIPILFISALSSAEDITAGFASGAVDYITKPFRESEVLARVRTHLALRATYLKLDQEHARSQLLERHRDMLTHMLVHDMRSPLQVIGGHLELIEDLSADDLPATAHDSLRAAIQGARLLGQMVATVIDLSRLETHEIPLQSRCVSVAQLFRAACAQSLGPADTPRITEQIEDPCPLLQCDVELSERILANLLVNALKYAPAGSEVVLGATPEPGMVRIWVRDHGPGIPAADRQRIFEKFEVIHRPAGNPQRSTGLGLAFCKLAVEAHGGTLGVDSRNGHGSTFWFTLPAASTL